MDAGSQLGGFEGDHYDSTGYVYICLNWTSHTKALSHTDTQTDRQTDTQTDGRTEECGHLADRQTNR